MNNIKILDDYTIQKIAAGEVIERPASVIKELMENSYDAGANNITIETLDGGKKSMKIIDDGSGISKRDIELAFMPHATSKLREIEDIYSISSYGFRGEALASISSVSDIELLTKTDNDELGIIAKIKENRIIEKKEIASPTGTSLKIDNLFYNLPVRQKLLKSNRSEDRAILDVIIRQALSNSNVSIKYYRDKSLILSSRGTSSVKDRIFSLLGKDFADGLNFIEYDDRDIKIWGGVSKTSLYRGTRSHQILFINNRHVFISGISKAIENFYRSLIPNGKFPCYVLFIEIPKSEVDINIHPNKREVKLLNQDKIIQSIIYSIKKEKEKENLNKIKQVDIFSKSVTNLENPLKIDMGNVIYKDYTGNIDEGDLNNFKVKPNSCSFEDEDLFSKVEFEIPTKEEITNKPLLAAENLLKYETNDIDSFDTDIYNENDFLSENLKVIGILFKTYILLEDEFNNAYIIDQHAAHERVLFEEYKEQFSKNKVEKQGLLMPEIISLSIADKENILRNKNKFFELGFEIEDFGGNDIALRSVPMMFSLNENREFIINMVDSIENINFQSDCFPEKIIKKACSDAVKAGDKINKLSAIELLKQLVQYKDFKTCPHGRPTIVKLSKRDFELAFLRV